MSESGGQSVGAFAGVDADGRARIRRFYCPPSPVQAALIWAARFVGVALVLLPGAGLGAALLDMDGHDPAEEPLRAFFSQVFRAPFRLLFFASRRLADRFGGVVAEVATFAALPVTALLFGFAVSALREMRRRQSERRRCERAGFGRREDGAPGSPR